MIRYVKVSKLFTLYSESLLNHTLQMYQHLFLKYKVKEMNFKYHHRNNYTPRELYENGKGKKSHNYQLFTLFVELFSKYHLHETNIRRISCCLLKCI